MQQDAMTKTEIFTAKTEMVNKSHRDLACHICLLAITILTAGCGSVAQSPVSPSPTAPVIPSAPAPPVSTGPHFALELSTLSQTIYADEPWNGTVSVFLNPTIIRPELPVRVVTTCGGQVQTHGLGQGVASFSCTLPVGNHSVTAVAEMGDGRRFSTGFNMRVDHRPTQVLPLYYDVFESWVDFTDVTFGFQTFAGATYEWNFGDGGSATTQSHTVKHRYEHPGPGGNKERQVSVRAIRDGRTLATGSVVGIW